MTILLGACSAPAIRCDAHLQAINPPLPLPRPALRVPSPGAASKPTPPTSPTPPTQTPTRSPPPNTLPAAESSGGAQ